MLQRLQNRVNVHFQPLFLLLLIAFLVVGSMTRKDHYLVVTKYTPSGVVGWASWARAAVDESAKAAAIAGRALVRA